MIKKSIDSYIQATTACINSLKVDDIQNILKLLIDVNKKGGKIYLCGNGGSAATASHGANDLNNAFSHMAGTMPAIALSDNVSLLTATANDHSYEDVFEFQLRYLLKADDVLITISGSGNSENVIKAALYAREKSAKVIAMVGFDGGRLKSLADCCFHAHVNNMQISEDMHMMCLHLLSNLISQTPHNGV